MPSSHLGAVGDFYGCKSHEMKVEIYVDIIGLYPYV